METGILYPRLRYYYRSLIPLFEKPKVAAYTMLVLSFFTVSIFGSFAIRPTLATIAQLRKSIEDQQILLNRMDDKITQLRVAQVEYNNILLDLSAIFEALPQKPQAASLLGKLNRILIENNIDISVLQISPIVLKQSQMADVASSNTIAFTLTGKAPYSDILTLVDLLSRTDRVITIDAIDIATIPTSTGTFTSAELLTFTIRGKSYVLLQEQKVNELENGGTGG